MLDTRHSDSEAWLDHLFEQLRHQEVPPMPVEHAAMRTPAPVSRPAQNHRFRMRRRVRVWAFAVLAAAVAAAVIPPLWVERPSAFAFADVRDAFNHANTVSYEWLCFSESEAVSVFRIMRAGQDHFRGETSNLYVDVYDLKQRLNMHVSHKEQSAFIVPIYSIEALQRRPNIADVAMRALSARSAKKIGERTIDGRKGIDFIVPYEGREYTVTADASTQLPIQIESRSTAGFRDRQLIRNFIFDASLDDALFAIQAPPGYRVERAARGVDEATYRKDVDLVVSPESGIGSARFGMSIGQVSQALGPPELTVVEPDKLTCVHYYSRGFDLAFRADEGLAIIRCWGEQHSDRPFLGRTKEGIRLGMTMDELNRVYPVRVIAIAGGGEKLEQAMGYDFGYFRHDERPGTQPRLSQIEVTSIGKPSAAAKRP
jgi:outer membrane lipoprotein-sorting protein